MALSRALLKGMSLTDEQVQAIIDAHRETVDGLKAELDKYKADAKALPGVQKELDDLKQNGGNWQEKYESEHKAFEAYKADIETKESVARVKEAYRNLLKAENVNEKHLEAVIRVTDFSKMKLKKDGTLEDADKLTEGIKNEWSDFIVQTEKKGADVETPPDGKVTRKPGRAAEIARTYHEGLYGAVEKKEN